MEANISGREAMTANTFTRTHAHYFVYHITRVWKLSERYFKMLKTLMDTMMITCFIFE